MASVIDTIVSHEGLHPALHDTTAWELAFDHQRLSVRVTLCFENTVTM